MVISRILAFRALFLLFMIPHSWSLGSISAPKNNKDGKNIFHRYPQSQSIDRQDMIIEAGMDVTIPSGVFNRVHVYGALRCNVNDDTSVATIYVNQLIIYNGGVFQCGDRSSNSPVNGKVEIVLTNTDSSDESQTLLVHNGGTMDIYGNTLKSFRTRLSHTAIVNDNVLTLRDSVQNYWEVGDNLVVATTEFNRQPNFGQNEQVTIESISQNGYEVTISPSLQFEHFGFESDEGSTYYANDIFYLDESAHIFNLNRNVIIRSDNELGPIGGHVKVLRGSNVKVEGLELIHMGQAGRVGRYPFHWHFAGNVNGQFIQKSSIHHSFQRCIVVHGTDEALVKDNTCFDFHGHGIMLEDGNEINNLIQKNLVVLAKKAIPGLELLQSEHVDVSIDRFPAPAGIWVSNPSNDVVQNVVISSEGTGLWMSFIEYLCCKAIGGCTQYYSTQSTCQANFGSGATFMLVNKMPTGRFDENVGASSVVGINWDGASTGTFINNPNNPQPALGSIGLGDREILITHYSPPSVPIFYENIMYKNSRRALYFRGEQAIFQKNIFADNGGAPLFAYNQVLKDCLVVGWSTNAELEYFFDQLDRSERMDIKSRKYTHGLNLYDGPLVLDNVWAAGFPVVPISRDDQGDLTQDYSPKLMMPVGATERFVNYAKGVYFEDDQKPDMLYSFNDPTILQAASLYDESGFISGTVGGTITGYEPINDDSNCNIIHTSSHAFVCTDYKVGTITYLRTTSDDAASVKIVRRNSDGIVRMDDPEFWTIDKRHFQVITSRGEEDYRYHITSFLANSPQLLTFIYRHDLNPGLSPPILMHYADICAGNARWEINGRVVTLASEDDLAAYSVLDTTAVFYDDVQKIAGIRASAIKNRTDLGLYPGSGARAESRQFRLVCNSGFIPSNLLNRPMAKMDVDYTGNSIRIRGWACIFSYDNAARVKLTAEQGNITLLSPTPTNIATSSGVANKCRTSPTSNNKFSFDINLPFELLNLPAIDLVLSVEGNSGPDNGLFHPTIFFHAVLDTMTTFSEYMESLTSAPSSVAIAEPSLTPSRKFSLSPSLSQSSYPSKVPSFQCPPDRNPNRKFWTGKWKTTQSGIEKKLRKKCEWLALKDAQTIATLCALSGSPEYAINICTVTCSC